jgi:alpha-tubulin suppressor-like RCC1 family protein
MHTMPPVVTCDGSHAGFWSTTPTSQPPRLLRNLATTGKAVDVAAGSYHSVVALDQSECVGFGTNKWWQLALPETRSYQEPEPVGSFKIAFCKLADVEHSHARNACALMAARWAQLTVQAHARATPEVRSAAQQIPGTAALVQLAAGDTFSGGLDANGKLSIWGTDTSNRGVFTKQHPTQLREPAVIEHASFDKVSLGFASAAGITRHGRLCTWGWSGNDLQVRRASGTMLS